MTGFVLIAEFEAQPGQEQRLRRELAAMVEPSLAEPGCLGYRPYVDPEQPTRMILVEEWSGPDALEQHFNTPHFAHVSAALQELLVKPFVLTRLVRLTGTAGDDRMKHADATESGALGERPFEDRPYVATGRQRAEGEPAVAAEPAGAERLGHRGRRVPDQERPL